MRKLVPPFITLLALIAIVFTLNAQNSIHNPELPETLTFQWKLTANEAHATWKNQDFFIHRDGTNLMILYGQFENLESALNNVPELPAGMDQGDLELLAFVNQTSVTSDQALSLIYSDYEPSEMEEHAVTFSVYLGTYYSLLAADEFPAYVEELSFEVLEDRSIQYNAGDFKAEQKAYDLLHDLKQDGFEDASIQPWLFGEQLAQTDLNQLYEYFAFMNW